MGRGAVTEIIEVVLDGFQREAFGQSLGFQDIIAVFTLSARGNLKPFSE